MEEKLKKREVLEPEKETDAEEKAEPTSKKVTNRLYTKRSLFIALIIILPLLAILFLPKTSHAPTPQILIAKVADKPVYLSDIRNVAKEQYANDAIDKNALSISYDVLIERLILSIEANRLGLSVSDKELKEKLVSEFSPTENIPDSIKTTIKYDLLKDKIVEKEIQSRQAFSIGFYTASYADLRDLAFSRTERALFTKQRFEGKQALATIQQKLQQGEQPLQIAQDILKIYPSLQTILDVNGYVVQTAADTLPLEKPQIYTYDENNASQPFFNALYTMQPNEIRIVEDGEGSGGDVIKVTAVNPTGAKSYEEWLANKKKELVKTFNTI